jgi:hypothetical protein
MMISVYSVPYIYRASGKYCNGAAYLPQMAEES